jgi:sugar phosphate isomerase/epimerase
MKEITYDESLRRSKSSIELAHKVRGKYLIVGSYSATQIAEIHSAEAV